MTTRKIARKKRDLNRLRGIPNRVPHAEAAARITELRSTMSWAELAAATGCSAAHLRNVVAGRQPRINRVTHNKIMAVRPSSGGHIFVDALGSRRRIQALQARGHSQYDIAAAAGTTQYRIYKVCSGQPTVRLRTAHGLVEAYRTLADREGTSTRGRNLAVASGWLGPEYWDENDLDDPEFIPAADDRLNVLQLGAHRRQEIEHLASFNVPEHEIADRLGMARAYVHDLIRDMGKAA